jgi:hypothetical protein
MRGAMEGMPSGPTLAMTWAAMIRASTAQRLVTAAGRQQGPSGLEILLGIHSDDGLVGLEHVDRDAGLQQPELLQLLRALERRRRQ